jgi:hypothetical protein
MVMWRALDETGDIWNARDLCFGESNPRSHQQEVQRLNVNLNWSRRRTRNSTHAFPICKVATGANVASAGNRNPPLPFTTQQSSADNPVAISRATRHYTIEAKFATTSGEQQ